MDDASFLAPFVETPSPALTQVEQVCERGRQQIDRNIQRIAQASERVRRTAEWLASSRRARDE
jgi:hypothetical protein